MFSRHAMTILSPLANATVSSGWTSTRKGRTELLAVALFALLNVIIPLWLVDLYPFSRAPMFADAPLLYCDYQVFDPDGKALPVLDFGLQRNYWGNPIGVGVGFRPPETVDRFGAIADQAEVTEMVRRRLATFPDFAFVDVQQDEIADQDGQRVGVVRGKRWRVPNPAFKGPTGS